MARSSLGVSRAVRSPPPMTLGSPGPRRSAPAERGFTLVELMIVVVIVGVLAVLAVVGFQKLIGTSRTTEAVQMVNSIKVGQEAFHAETGAYDDISQGLCVTTSTCANFYPQASEGVTTVGAFKASWGVPCTAGCQPGTDWLQLSVHAQGNVMYGYTTIAGTASNATTLVSTNGVSAPTSIGTGNAAISINASFANGIPSDWYFVAAVGNSEDNANPCVVMGTSFQSDLVISGEGN
ncbi:MAG: prepilin-type N-terminal cleavage/methylation domain-containing protein [Polyangiaceae bacterium]